MKIRSKSVRTRTITTGIIAIVGILVLLSSCAGKSNPVVTVNTATATSGRLIKPVEFSGILTPDQTVNVYSQQTGHATQVTVSVGDKVEAGQLLVKIDSRELNAQLAEAEASMRSVEDQASQAQVGISTAKANLDLAQKSFDRISALYKTQAVPKNQMDDVQNKLELAQSAYQNAQKQYQLLSGSGLAQAKARIELIQVQISNTTIASPIDGVVTNKNVNPGELVTTGAPVMTVADTSTLKLQGTVSQDAVPLMSMGQKVQVRVDGLPNVKYEGTITQIGPVAVSTGQYFPVVVSLKNNGSLLAGMTAMSSFNLTAP
ncbi:MAG TPA: efflux RND transporter periplasmic adaptor subunit, partial [Spirochaetia bacterium]|nr:efflux RND transporter periplasmic adaptor subunit [Spirochaetia bacterium]